LTERIIEFGSAGNLVGILNQPKVADDADKNTTVIFLNAGTLHRVGPSRLYVRIARRLAELGIASLRFDFSGLGDSPPRTDGLPFHQYSIEEVGDAIDYLSRDPQKNSFVLLGMCSGADTAWYTAVANERITGVVLLDGFAHRNLGFYWHHYIRRVFDASVWKKFFQNPGDAFNFLLGKPDTSGAEDTADEVVFDRDWPDRKTYHDGISKLVSRNVNMYYIFTGGVEEYLNHEQQFLNSYRAVKNYDRLKLDYYPEADHLISATEIQLPVIEDIARWAEEFPPGSN